MEKCSEKKNNHSRTFQLAAQKPLALCSPTTVHTAHCFLYLSCWWHTLDTILQHITTAVKWRRPWTHHYSFIVAPFCNWIHRVWKIRQNEVRRKFLLLPQWTFLYSVIYCFTYLLDSYIEEEERDRDRKSSFARLTQKFFPPEKTQSAEKILLNR